MKKIFALALAVIMVMGSFSAVFAEEAPIVEATDTADVQKEEYIKDLIGKAEGGNDEASLLSEYAEVLKSVYPEYKSYSDLNDKISREDFLVVLVNLVYGKNYPASTLFGDVSSDKAALLESLSCAVKVGMVSPSGAFRPDDAITYSEMYKMAVVALGYNMLAEQNGGWPAGYMFVASKTGLTENVEGSDGEVSAKDALTVLYNVITLEFMEQTSFGETLVYTVAKGKSILSERYDIELISGIVNADDVTSITDPDATLSKGEITIGTKTYKNKSGKSLLGYHVKAYVRTSGNSKEIISIHKYENRDIFANDFSLIAANRIRVNTPDGKHKDYNIYKGYSAILNNVAAPYLDLNDYVNRDDVTLYIIDNNDDGVYDVVKVYDWDYMQAGKLDNVNALVFDLNTPSALLNLNPDDASVKIYECTGENIVAVDFNSIKEADILTYIISSNQKSVMVFKTANKLSASLDEYNATEQKISLNGIFYELSDYAVSNFPSVTLGIDTTIYLDATGVVIAISQSGETKYGYIVDMAKEDFLGGVYKVKMFTHTGEMSIIPVEDKVLIDAVSKTDKDLFDKEQSLSDDDRMVKYATNESGNINIVDFAEMADALLPFTEVKPANNDFTCYYDDIYNKAGNGFFSTAFIAEGDTLMFHIPKSEAYKTDDERYMIRTYSSYRNGDLDVRAYDMEPGHGPKVILCFNDGITTPVDEYTGSEVVMEITQGANDEGDLCKLLKTYDGTNYKTYYVLKDSFTKCPSFSDVMPGDIVALSVYQNEIMDIKIQYSYFSNSILQAAISDKRIFYKGYIYAYSSKAVQLWNTMNPKVETPTIPTLYTLDFREQAVTFVDIYKDADGKITKAMARYKPLTEIKDYVHAGTNADFMVANMAGLSYDDKWIYRVVER